MTTRRLTFAVSIGGILWFVFMLTIPDFMAVPGFAPFQPDPNRQGWLNRILEGLYKLPGAALGYLVVLAMLSLVVGICLRLARRRAAFERLSTPTPHGKYLPWGRNPRRHPSIPARHSGLRPRKRLRPLRRTAH